MILWSEGGTKMQEDEAQAILEALTVAYPGHPWGVRVYDGGFFIRHLDFDAAWGMNCKTRTSYSASSLKREVIMMAGEWLERAGLKRGMGEDDNIIKRVEGVPENYQPKEAKDPVQIAAVETIEAMRTAPLPAAEKIIKATDG